MECFVIIFLIIFVIQSTLAKEVEKCIIYPVNNETNSPSFVIKENNIYQVTINSYFPNESMVWFLDENDELVFHLNLAEYLDLGQDHFYSWYNRDSVDMIFLCKNHELFVDIIGYPTRDIIMEKLPQKLKIKSNDQINIIFDCPTGCKTFETVVIRIKLITNPSTFRIYGKITNTSNFNDKVTLEYGKKIYIQPLKEFSSSYLNEKLETNWTYFDIIVFRKWLKLDNESSRFIAKINVTSPTLHTNVPSQISVKDYEFDHLHINMILDFRNSMNLRWSMNCKPEEISSIRKGDNDSEEGCVPARCCIGVTSILAMLLLVTLFAVVVCKVRGYLNLPPCPIGETGDVDSQEEDEYAYVDLEELQSQLERERVERENNQQNPEEMSQEEREAEDGDSNHSTVNSIYEGFEGNPGSGSSEGNDQESIGHSSINSIYERFDDASSVTDANSQQKISKRNIGDPDDSASNIAGTNSSEKISHGAGDDDLDVDSDIGDDNNH